MIHTVRRSIGLTPKVLIVVGSRPEAIKLAPVVRMLRDIPHDFKVILCSTGQQRDLVPPALADFGLEPDVKLNVMQANQTLASLNARILERIDEVIVRESPHWVVVQGDTTSAMAGALAAFYRKVPVAHVEAGMRTRNRFSPFPEEVNRRIITQCATLHLAATPGCRENLIAEGVPEKEIYVTGNTVVDALLWMRDRTRTAQSALPPQLRAALSGKRVVLITSHRRESFGRGLDNICAAITQLSRRFAETVFVYPVHPNPNVYKPVTERLQALENVLLIDPLPYRALVELLDLSYLVLTDSGGIQEEAPTFGKPVLVLRDTTERPEGVKTGVARLVGSTEASIVSHAVLLLTSESEYARMTGFTNPYGDGQAATRIRELLRTHSSTRNELSINKPTNTVRFRVRK